MNPMSLTKDDIAAMRGANHYHIHLTDGVARLTLTRLTRISHPGYPSEEVSTRREIEGTAGNRVSGFFSHYPSGAWSALAKLVKPGDVLMFSLYPDNSNQYLKSAAIPSGAMEGLNRVGYPRLYADELWVSVLREGVTFLSGLVLGYSICPDNSARAVKGGGQ